MKIMKMKKIAGILLAIALTVSLFTLYALPVAAEETEPPSPETTSPTNQTTLSNVVVTGSVGVAIGKQTVKINKASGIGDDYSLNTTVTEWFTNMPGGLVAKVSKNTDKTSQVLEIEISGTPTKASSEAMEITIPAPCALAGTITPDPHAKWDISPTAQVTFSVTPSTTYGTITATVYGKGENGEYTEKDTITNGKYVNVGDKVEFKAAPKVGYSITGWTATKKTGSDGTGNISFDDKADEDDEDDETDYSTANIRGIVIGDDVTKVDVKVAFAIIPEYRLVLDEGIYDKDGNNKPIVGTKTMKFGEKYGETDPKRSYEVITVTKVTSNKPDGNNEYEAIESNVNYTITAKSDNEAVAKISKVAEDGGDDESDKKDFKLKLTAMGEGTAKITLTASEVIPDNDSDDYTIEYKDGTISFTVKVTAADTTLTLSTDANEVNVITASTARLAVTAVTEDDDSGSSSSGGGDDDDDEEKEEKYEIQSNMLLKLDLSKEIVYFAENADGKIAVLSGVSDYSGYTTDGGKKWTPIKIYAEPEDNNDDDDDDDGDDDEKDDIVSIASITEILDKPGTDVRFAEKLGSDGKPAGGSAIWKIGKINSRPNAPKPTIVYGKTPGGKADGSDNDSKWYFSGISSDTTFMYVPSADGKTPDEGKEWKHYQSDKDAEDISPWNYETSKIQKDKYLAKLGPNIKSDSTTNSVTSITPSSKVAKITVSGFLKPPKLKVDYKKELVTLKGNMYYVVGETVRGDVSRMPGSDDFKGSVLVAKDQARLGVSFAKVFENTSPALNSQRSVYVYTAATGKKPRSATAEFIVNYYKSFEGDPATGFNPVKHRYKLPKGFEIFDPAKNKWVTSVRVIQGATYEVRQKGNAKYNAKDLEKNLKAGTSVASTSKFIKFTWGEYIAKEATEKRAAVKKQGILSVEILDNLS